ncbi:MAG TPA: anti-sigma factor [Candidatus Acidoferrum sp.]|jgi:anti-sigma factor RsiW
MSCERTETTVHGYFDNELDALGAAEFERHLEQCPECAAALDSLKSLRSSMIGSQLYEKTPASVRRKVLKDVHSASPIPSTPTVTPAQTPWSWLAVAAALILFAYAGWRVASVYRGANNDEVLAAEAVDAHLRSLQPGHLTDIISTDQHTVKPWFDGKLDFSPPVRDFSEQGFPLEGGRLDVVHGRTVAALVYGRRKHFVSVFIWPVAELEISPRAGSSRGYQWLDWRKGGMEFYAVSDTSSADLAQLQRLFTE